MYKACSLSTTEPHPQRKGDVSEIFCSPFEETEGDQAVFAPQALQSFL